MSLRQTEQQRPPPHAEASIAGGVGERREVQRSRRAARRRRESRVDPRVDRVTNPLPLFCFGSARFDPLTVSRSGATLVCSLMRDCEVVVPVTGRVSCAAAARTRDGTGSTDPGSPHFAKALACQRAARTVTCERSGAPIGPRRPGDDDTGACCHWCERRAVRSHSSSRPGLRGRPATIHPNLEEGIYPSRQPSLFWNLKWRKERNLKF